MGIPAALLDETSRLLEAGEKRQRAATMFVPASGIVGIDVV